MWPNDDYSVQYDWTKIDISPLSQEQWLEQAPAKQFNPYETVVAIIATLPHS